MQLIYDPTSTSSRIVTFFLHDFDIPFQSTAISLADGMHREDNYLQKNPNGEVPVLVEEDGFTLSQSSVILRYVADKLDLPAYSKDRRRRAEIDQAISWFQTNFFVFHCALNAYTHILPVFRTMEPPVLQAVRGMGVAGAAKYLAVLNEHMIGDRAFVCGEEITLADYVGAANVTLGYAAQVDFGPYPNIQRWLEKLRTRKGWVPAYRTFENMLGAARIPASIRI